jgi:hypothetical protein
VTNVITVSAMPLMQTATSSMNAAFGPGAIEEIDADSAASFQPGNGTSLGEALVRIPGTNLSDAVLAYIDGWPSALQAALQAAIHNNLTREGRVPITFAWVPGYDYGITIHDVVDTATSRGGMTVLVSSRYPADTHPLAASSA